MCINFVSYKLVDMSLKEKIKNSLSNTRRQLYSMFEALFTSKSSTDELKLPRNAELYEKIETDTLRELDKTLEETMVEFGESLRRSLDVLDAEKVAKSHLHLASNGSGALAYLRQNALTNESIELSL